MESNWRTLQDRARQAKRAGDLKAAISQIQAALTAASKEPSAVKASLYNMLADYARNAGDLTTAISAARAGVEERRGKSSDTALGNDLMMLAQIHDLRGEAKEAQTIASEARALYAAELGEDHGEVRFIDSFIKRLASR